METFDLSMDQNQRELYRYSQLVEFPAYVKSASWSRTVRPEGAMSAAFADPVHRQFPCHSKAACYLSSLRFFEQQSRMPERVATVVREGLKQAAARFGVAQDVQDAVNRLADVDVEHDEDLPDSAFAVVDTDASGMKDRRYPLRNVDEVKTAAAWLVQHRDQIEFDDRKRIAGAVLDKAAEFACELDEEQSLSLDRMACRGFCDQMLAAKLLRKRASWKDCSAAPPVREGLVKLASALEQSPTLAFDPGVCEGLARTIDQFDRGYGLVHEYDKGLPRPEDVAFSGSYKHAKAYVQNAVPTLTGATYLKHQFSKISASDLRAAFGDLAESMVAGLLADPDKMAEVAPTLPRRDAEKLDDLMLRSGQIPVRKQASALGLTDEERQKLAAEYRFACGLPEPASLAAPSGSTGGRIVTRQA